MNISDKKIRKLVIDSWRINTNQNYIENPFQYKIRKSQFKNSVFTALSLSIFFLAFVFSPNQKYTRRISADIKIQNILNYQNMEVKNEY